VRERADEHGRTRVLVDLTAVRQAIPDTDRYLLGEEIARTWRGLIVAAVDPTETPDRFVQHVATNRGANLRLFDSEEAAIGWLTESKP
jgi:hypothetical protein